MNGVLVVDKPIGPTSHDVVARVRRALRTRRIGHTGTLDPLATGVLPLVIGSATRLAMLLTGADKEYVAGIRLGLTTDTYDAAGLAGAPPSAPLEIDAAALDEALDRFRGRFAQSPPPFSAKKMGGVPAYKLARRKQPVQPPPVNVSVQSLSLVSYEAGLARVRVRASAGFYVRSLAHDLGQALGCGAYLEALRRVQAGSFDEGSSTPLEVIEHEGMEAGRRLIPLERLLPDIPAVTLNDRGLKRATHGNEVAADDVVSWGREAGASADDGTRCRLLDQSGSLVGIAESRPDGLLHPVIVLV